MGIGQGDARRRLALAVRKNRHRSGLSEQALAERAGLRLAVVEGIERACGDPELLELASLASVFGMRLSELVSEVEAGDPPDRAT